MGNAISAAKLACELALNARDRNRQSDWARERYEYALLALSHLEEMDDAANANDPAAASNRAA